MKRGVSDSAASFGTVAASGASGDAEETVVYFVGTPDVAILVVGFRSDRATTAFTPHIRRP